MSVVNMSTAAGQGLTQWDIGLSKTTADVIRARLSLYGDGLLCDFVHALRDLRQYIIRSARRREASPTLESTLATVLSPLLQEFYTQENSYDVLDELLDIVVLLGQSAEDIIAMMVEQGIFHILTTMLMYVPTTEVTSACLGRLAGTSDSAAHEAQIAILASGMALTCPPSAASAPESSAMAALHSQQTSALPVVYKLLTAEDKGSQKVAIEMLTFLCEMGSEWQTQEQLNLAKFDNGVILAHLVQRIGQTSNQTKLSTTKAIELANLLQLLSSATSGCETAQSKVEEHHILQHLVTLLTPSNQRIRLLVALPLHGTRVLTKIEPDFKLARQQMIEVLIAMTNVVSQHEANQAVLGSLARPLSEALAAWLSTFPSTLQATDTPEASLTNVPGASTAAQTDSAAMRNNIIVEEECDGTAPHTAPHESSLMASKPATSALTARLKGQKPPSLLTSKLKGSMPTKGDTRDPSGSAHPSGPAQNTASTQRAESGKESTSKRPEDGEVQLARRFVYHLLLHLPVEVLRGRQDFWMEHAVGLPELMQSCIGVAVMQEPIAVQSLRQLLQLWVDQPGGRSAEALQWLTNFPAVVQGLVQTVSGEAASEAIQILSIMSQQGGGVGGVLGAAGAAEAIVAAALARSDIAAFQTTKELSDLVVRVLPDSHAAVSIIQECQAAILTATSPATRHRAISIIRAMSSLLDAAPTPQHDVTEEEVHHSQPAVPAVPAVPAAEARSATDATADADKDNISAENPFKHSAGSTPIAHSAFRSDPASQPGSFEQAFAMEMLNWRHGGSVDQVQPQQVPDVAEADIEAGTESLEEAGHEADQAGEEEALAAARRQQIVDDAMDMLFEDMTDEACTKELLNLSRASSGLNTEYLDTADSGLWLSGSDADSSTRSSAAAGKASEEEEEEFSYTYTSSRLADEEEHPRQREEAEEQGPKEEGYEDEGKEEENSTELQALAITGFERAFRQPPQSDIPPISSSTTSPYSLRDRSLAMPEQGLSESAVKPRAVAGDATEERASSSSRRLCAVLTAAMSSAAAAAAAPTAQTLARPNQQSSTGLPSLALSRSSRKNVKPTPDEETVLLPSQQASGLTSQQAPQAREQSKQLSQAEMQHLVDFVFQRGFERMGQIADESLVDPAASAVDVDVDEPAAAAATAAPVPAEGVVEKTHDELQDAFNKLVQHGLHRHGNRTRTELEGAALSQAVAGATTTPITTRATAAPSTTAATAGSSGPEGATAVATASTSRRHRDMDNVPKALVVRERVRVARSYMEDELPPFHSVFSRYGSDRHVREIQELTDCQRQVGFAVEQKQKPFQMRTAFKMILALPGVMLATGIARGMRQQRKSSAKDDLLMHELSQSQSDDSSDWDYDY